MKCHRVGTYSKGIISEDAILHTNAQVILGRMSGLLWAKVADRFSLVSRHTGVLRVVCEFSTMNTIRRKDNDNFTIGGGGGVSNMAVSDDESCSSCQDTASLSTVHNRGRNNKMRTLAKLMAAVLVGATLIVIIGWLQNSTWRKNGTISWDF